MKSSSHEQNFLITVLVCLVQWVAGHLERHDAHVTSQWWNILMKMDHIIHSQYRYNAVHGVMILHIKRFNYSSRTRIRLWTSKRHPISRPQGRAMGYQLWEFQRKLTALIRHCTLLRANCTSCSYIIPGQTISNWRINGLSHRLTPLIAALSEPNRELRPNSSYKRYRLGYKMIHLHMCSYLVYSKIMGDSVFCHNIKISLGFPEYEILM